MVAGANLSGDLTETQWLAELEEIGEEEGYFSPLGDNHAAVFVDRSQKVLFVAFETVTGIRATSERGLPLGFDVCESRGWSHLTILATSDTWYRDRFVYGYFDRLVDEGFFEDFDHVVFYGAGMCGYAAAAFSVVAPGASVIAVAPQATLERRLTEWDDRFPKARGLDFRSRYGYAPFMLEAAGQALVIYDPDETEDAMHATLFQGANIEHVRYRRGRSGAIDGDLRAMGLVSRLAEAAVAGALDPAAVGRIFKARHRHVPYLRAVLARTLGDDRPYLTALLCRAVLDWQPIPRFRHHLGIAEHRLAERGGTLPERMRERAG
ncbi:phosphoadenosine phosphosulfate reductase [Alphaproteobacteria bacterium GH1-50]|uniref:Phosphoadenosine phosphosulfate reductase n=1 Tax=Kangsaoukella pontilimi TaxID=2691042 RepID=A0A7C9J2Q4_9RHOB|nr:phosphoadenosine phosphosulfate reductase [Kangsaoukella pontilimi]MXQ07701.1 phosphoadenosine phosphosulfate reductase [Kangsaoukella pontilimi]